MENKKIVLSCNDIWVGYDNKPVIRTLNLDIYEGDYITIVGENGSGKSTLVKTLLGLLKPISGQIIVHEVQSGIGYLPQQTQVQRDFPASVYEVVVSGFLNKAKNRPFYTSKEKNKAIEHMELLHIQDLKKRCYRELSGGQQQRVLLARALCAAENLLILDEPVTGLDPVATKELYENLRILNKERNMTIIMISHDLKNALEQADKVLSIEQNTYKFGMAEEFFNCEREER